MKFTPEVIAALTVLRNAAENDFERHRISILERDLTSPPQVEVIDDTHQRFNGVTYWKAKKDGHYYRNFSLHHTVWQYCCGDIPSPLEYDIHHRDWNPDNNQPINLQKMTRGEHHALHTYKHGKYRQKEKVCPICGVKFIAGIKKYCSRECYHRAIQHTEKTCPVCGKIFIPSQQSVDCCSRSCAAKLRCQNTLDEEKTCPVCGTKFIPEKKQTIYCSKSCYKKAQHKTCTCVICGKEFLNKSNADVSTCSPSCAGKLRWQTRKSHKQ